ncbi:hypothetical protein BKA70DRAFT_1222876 [Coprinopsis sp. MPI-PUGE-AT-0042]|nr:hypothetical protein BKA70DRAFT_1222876 [Coprinopsis sp. MPI-PUGE-AT-0042]
MDQPEIEDISIIPTGAEPLAPPSIFSCERPGCAFQNMPASEFKQFRIHGTDNRRTFCHQHAREKKEQTIRENAMTAHNPHTMPAPGLTKQDMKDIRDRVNEGQRLGGYLSHMAYVPALIAAGNKIMALPPNATVTPVPGFAYSGPEVIQPNMLMNPSFGLQGSGYGSAHAHHSNDTAYFQSMAYHNPAMRLAYPQTNGIVPPNPPAFNSRQTTAPAYAPAGTYPQSPTPSPEKGVPIRDDVANGRPPTITIKLILHAVDEEDGSQILIGNEGLGGIPLHVSPSDFETRIVSFLQQIMKERFIPPLEKKSGRRVKLALKSFTIRDGDNVLLNGPGMPRRKHMFQDAPFFAKIKPKTGSRGSKVTLDEEDSAAWLKATRRQYHNEEFVGGVYCDAKPIPKPVTPKKRQAEPFPFDAAEEQLPKRNRSDGHKPPPSSKAASQASEDFWMLSQPQPTTSPGIGGPKPTSSSKTVKKVDVKSARAQPEPSNTKKTRENTPDSWVNEPYIKKPTPKRVVPITFTDEFDGVLFQPKQGDPSHQINPEVKLAEETLERERSLNRVDPDPSTKDRQALLVRRGARTSATNPGLNLITDRVVLQDIERTMGSEHQLRHMAWGHVSYRVDDKLGSGATKLAIKAKVWVDIWAQGRGDERPLGPAHDVKDIVLKKTLPELSLMSKKNTQGEGTRSRCHRDRHLAGDMVKWVNDAQAKHYEKLEGPPAIPSHEVPVVEYVRGCLAIVAKEAHERVTYPFGARAVWMIEEMIEGDFTKFICNRKAAALTAALEAYPRESRYLEYLQHMSFVQTGYTSFISDLQGCVQGNRIVLTDPQIITCQGKGDTALPPLFASGNLRTAAHAFWFEHTCNDFCKFFNLQPLVGEFRNHDWVDTTQVNRETYEAALLRYHKASQSAKIIQHEAEGAAGSQRGSASELAGVEQSQGKGSERTGGPADRLTVLGGTGGNGGFNREPEVVAPEGPKRKRGTAPPNLPPPPTTRAKKAASTGVNTKI